MSTPQHTLPHGGDMLADDWMDQPNTKRSATREFLHDLLYQPLRWLRRGGKFLTTTPGTMTAMIVLLSVAIIAAGVSMSQTSAQRRADLDTLISNTEPVSYSAHNLYTSLSLADTSATVGFVRTGQLVESTRQSYYAEIEQAARAAALTASGLDSHSGMEQLVKINQLLPVYTGLVDTAWANNRQGNPVGAAYMSEANALMRLEILPAANQLYRLTNTDVINSQQKLATPQWVPLSGLFAALLFLILAQLWLARTTRRRLNKGFVVATVLMTIATGWVVVATILTWQAGSRAYEEAARPLEEVTSARILAQQARTNETLSLVLRQAQDSSSMSFPSAQVAVRDALDVFENSTLISNSTNRSNLTEARESMSRWSDTHDQLVEQLNGGNYERAVELALGTGGAPVEYVTLDRELAALADEARESLRGYMSQGAAASSFVNLAVLILSLIAVLAVWLGIRPRLQEYL